MKEKEIVIGREKIRSITHRKGLQVVTKEERAFGLTTQWVHRDQYSNHVWSYDFIFDQTEDRQTFNCMTVVDEFTRQGFDIHVGHSITALDVIRILDKLFRRHGKPVCLGSDNEPKLITSAVQQWLKKMHVKTCYIATGSPWQNSYCERQFDFLDYLPGSVVVKLIDGSACREYVH